MSKRSTLKKTLIAAAVAAALGTSAAASAQVIHMDWTGAFTMLSATGGSFVNTDYTSVGPWYGNRTAVSGTMMFDTVNGTGTGTVNPFSFFGGGTAVATSVVMQAIGNGTGGTGPLVLGNMGFNWSGNNGIPVSIVLDASGLFGAVQQAGSAGLQVGQVITGGALAASDDTLFGGRTKYTLPLGPSPIVTTTWNTTDIGTVALGTNPSGTLPLITDTVVDSTNGDIGIGGSPMEAGPFPGDNANFDITSITVVAPVPIPAAVWLFGSGLLGLVGVARRRNKRL